MNPIVISADDHEAAIARLRKQILERYPIGSEWYCPGQDDIVEVVAHFEPRGIICLCSPRPTPERPECNYTCLGFGDLINGSVIVPRAGGFFDEYRRMRTQHDLEFAKLMQALPAGRVWQ